MLDISGTTISLTRGDTARIQLTLTHKDGTAYVPTAGDAIRFAVKRAYKDAEPLLNIDIPTNTLLLEIAHSDTAEMAYGKYKYDIELTAADGTVDTFIDRAEFILTEEVL